MDWVTDPGNNASRLGIYERTISLYWTMKNLMGHVLWEKQKNDDSYEGLMECWKSHHVDTSLLNQKVDAIMVA